MKKIINQEPGVEIIVRFNDGRQAICTRMFRSEKEFLKYVIDDDELQWIKAYEVFLDGVRLYSWVRKRG